MYESVENPGVAELQKESVYETHEQYEFEVAMPVGTMVRVGSGLVNEVVARACWA